MRASKALIALLGSLALDVWAVDKPPPLPPEPDHLTPVDPYPGDWHVHYSDEIRGRLGLQSPFLLQMLVCPSFSPEYAVRMVVEGKDAFGDLLDLGRAEKIALCYTIADKSIWYAMPENNGEKKQKHVKISTKTADLPKPLAQRVHRLWKKMLLRTRYPEFGGSGLDGTTYEFAIWCVYGEVWTPQQRQSPLLLVELGESLIGYCKADPFDQQAALQMIEAKATQLEKYLGAHPEK